MVNSLSSVEWVFGALLAVDAEIPLIVALWLDYGVAVTGAVHFDSKLDLREILFLDAERSKVVRKTLMYGSRRDNPGRASDHPDDYRWLRTVFLVLAVVAAPFQPAAQPEPVAQAVPAAPIEHPYSETRMM